MPLAACFTKSPQMCFALRPYLNLDRFGVQLLEPFLDGLLQLHQAHLQELGQESLTAPVNLAENKTTIQRAIGVSGVSVIR